jgi:hypothetical protein
MLFLCLFLLFFFSSNYKLSTVINQKKTQKRRTEEQKNMPTCEQVPPGTVAIALGVPYPVM